MPRIRYSKGNWGDVTAAVKLPMAGRPVAGRTRVARFFATLLPRYAADPRFAHLSVAEVNGQPAVLAGDGGTLLAVLVPEIAPAAGDGVIAAPRITANPDKLAFARDNSMIRVHSPHISRVTNPDHARR